MGYLKKEMTGRPLKCLSTKTNGLSAFHLSQNVTLYIRDVKLMGYIQPTLILSEAHKV